jgi:hypothetical protein
MAALFYAKIALLLEDCRNDGSGNGPLSGDGALSLRREMWKNGTNFSLR